MPHVFLYLLQLVSGATFLHQFKTTKCTSTFAAWAIIQKNWIPPVSFANLHPCIHILLTEMKARKRAFSWADIQLVSLAMWRLHQQHFGLKQWHHIPHVGLAQYCIHYCVVLDLLLCGMGSITVWYQICCIVSSIYYFNIRVKDWMCQQWVTCFLLKALNSQTIAKYKTQNLFVTEKPKIHIQKNTRPLELEPQTTWWLTSNQQPASSMYICSLNVYVAYSKY